jgi:hypothetical protein
MPDHIIHLLLKKKKQAMRHLLCLAYNLATTQFNGLDIYFYKSVGHLSKINIISIQANKFDIP